MTTVGIIANPAAGKDVRRLVAHASTFDNNEKVNIVRRVLLGLDAVGVERVLIMPDSFAIGMKALKRIDLSLDVEILDMPTTFSDEDSTLAAERMRALGAGCIVTLGGDGTNRAVTLGCGDVPLVPISTGTNNAFPRMIEGTIGGLAAGVVACDVANTDTNAFVNRSSRLDVWRNDELLDVALIDVVVVDELFVGSRAVWDVDKVRQIVQACVRPNSVGFSSVGGMLPGLSLDAGQGLAIDVGRPAEVEVLAPVAPGLLRQVPVSSYSTLSTGDSVAVKYAPAVLALDGERKIEVRPEDELRIRLNAGGPRVVDIEAAMRAAVRAGLFMRGASAG